MKKIEKTNLNRIVGSGFWGGLGCGLTIGGAILVPTPITIAAAVGVCMEALDLD
jgi:hypothetical protein